MTLDITERQLRVAFRNVPVPMLAHDETGRIRFLSETLLNITGYNRDQLPTLQAWLDLVYEDPEMRTRVLEAHRAGYGELGVQLQGGGEYRIRTAYGAYRMWRFRAYSIGRDENGLAVNVSMAADVTSERATLDALSRSEAILRQALRIGGAGAFERHVHDRVTLLSDDLLSILGLPAEAARESFDAFYRRVHPEDRARVVAEVETAGRPLLAIEYRVIRASDGEVRHIAERSETQGEAEGDALVSVGMQRDVTDARAAEEALRVSEERLRLSLELGQVGTFDWNLIDNTVQWNARTREIWGFDGETPISHDQVYEHLHPDDVAPLRAIVQRSHDANGDGVYETEYRVINARDGRVRHVSARGRTLFQDGRAVRMVGVVVDVTALRDAAAVLERDRAELEQRVEARTRELAETQTRLAHAQRMEALGHLAGGIAHDFNNVLQAIEAAADLIERRPDPANLPRYLRMAREATKRGSAISRRLSSLSRRSELEPEPMALRRCLEDIADVVRRTAPASLTVQVEAPPDLPAVLADRRQLETALLNLAANAREAMEDSGILTFRAAADLSGAKSAARCGAELGSGDFVRVEIADTGRGMTSEVRARAAEPFFSTKPRGQGVGLGLSMARGFADHSGGALGIESQPGEGAVVALWLPVAENVGAPAPAPARAGCSGRLMVVDDDPLVRELVGEQLRCAGYEVAAFADGRSAIAALDAGLMPDLLLTDFAMPEMNGVELGRGVRARRPSLPVVVLTGYASEAADAAGDEDFALWRKPIDGDALIGRVAVLLNPA